jgi:hypothetical protein
MEPHSKITDSDFNKFYSIFTNVFKIIYDMNILSTGINEKWLDDSRVKIKNLNELYNDMVFGRVNLFFPTDYHIAKLGEYTQTIEKKADSYERDKE